MAEANEPDTLYEHNLMKPYIFFDVSAGREARQGSGSLRNQVDVAHCWPLFLQSCADCLAMLFFGNTMLHAVGTMHPWLAT